MVAVDRTHPGAGPTPVPVEHRWLGLDRRTIPAALVVLAIMLVFMIGIPALDQAVAWDDETVAGDVIDLGAGVTIVPPVGWELTAGIRTGDEPRSGVSDSGADAVISRGGVTIGIRRSGFDGTSAELLDQVDRLRSTSEAVPNRAFELTGPRSTVTTETGLTGVAEAYTSASGSGRVVAFAFGDGTSGATTTGVAITIDADDQAYAAASADIEALLDSLTHPGAPS